ncbi:LexA family transcriptional regulator [Rhizobium sp. RM]|uniref:LexA family transcriptional regulator n=1 Tax=Rhizobium sp. RM TaxID=2748079 RepID=UPI00110E167E|nr:LexA family transcriptional regulator [Rhizobium sp. RM]NWJ24749.1 XRE family transcriptional regulator [Rhizobium sp. RM]TMV16549.1 XRE family transcriptional regulator [Rhizobium sp. Td3]
MSNVLINRINQRLSELGKAVQRVSLEATGAKETLRKILDGSTKNPRIDTIAKLAIALETTPEWLTGQSDSQVARAVPNTSETDIPVPRRDFMPNDVPVMGTAAGSHSRGAFQLMPGPVDYVRRPPALMGAKGIYSLFVEGTSMEPQYFPGDLIYVHPNKPPRAGDAVIIQCRNIEEDGFEGTLGIYLKRTEKFVIIKKHNPLAEVQISRETIVSVHKVLTTNELFGV